MDAKINFKGIIKMKDFRSLEHKIRNIVSETVTRNTEQRMKIKNVGRPEDTDRSKLAKQAEIKTKIIDEESVEEASAMQQRTAAAALATQRGEYDAGKKNGAINRMSAMKPEDLKKIMKNAKHKVKEDDQSDDPIARINNVTNNLKQMTN